MEQVKARQIAERQNTYQKQMYNMMISPARLDPFADGKAT